MAPTRTQTRTGTQFAQRKGGYIYKSNAKKTYKLSDAELETIIPIKEYPNPRDSRTLVTVYNLCDVEALEKRVRGNAGPSVMPAPATQAVELAARNGRRILHSKVKEQYGFTNKQLEEIKPVSVEPNPHGGKYPMKHYNICDVEELAERLGIVPKIPGTPKKKRAVATPTSSATPSPSKNKGKAKASKSIDAYDDDRNISYDYDESNFGGMDYEEGWYELMGKIHR